MRTFLIICFLFTPFCWNWVYCDAYSPPVGYYTSAEGLEGSALKSALRQIIDNHTSLSYTPEVWTAHKDIYEDPQDSSRLMMFYSNQTMSKDAQAGSSASADNWNREHLWPNSYGIDGQGPAYTDLFHLVPANYSVNQARGNLVFDVSNPIDGGFRSSAHSLALECSSDSDSWEPRDEDKGWVGRSMLYMDVRYSHLELVDDPPGPAPSSTANRMAQLTTLLQWGRSFAVTQEDRRINHRIYTSYQHNRNPFIDYPELIDAVYTADDFVSWGSWRIRHFTFNELDNEGTSGPESDPEGDGVCNLIELAFNMDPWINDRQLLPRSGISEEGFPYIQYRELNNPEASGLVYEVEWSDDAVNWMPMEGGDVFITEQAMGDVVDVKVTHLDGEGAGMWFFRIVVTQDEDGVGR